MSNIRNCASCSGDPWGRGQVKKLHNSGVRAGCRSTRIPPVRGAPPRVRHWNRMAARWGGNTESPQAVSGIRQARRARRSIVVNTSDPPIRPADNRAAVSRFSRRRPVISRRPAPVARMLGGAVDQIPAALGGLTRWPRRRPSQSPPPARRECRGAFDGVKLPGDAERAANCRKSGCLKRPKWARAPPGAPRRPPGIADFAAF